MKKILISLIILLLLGWLYFHYRGNTSSLTSENSTSTATTTTTNDVTTSTEKVIEDKTHSVQLTIPNTYTVVTPTPLDPWRVDATTAGTILIKVVTPKDYQPHTNFSEATLTVGRSSNTQEIQNCTKNPSMPHTNTTIQGVPFSKYTFNGAAAGNFYETTSYRTVDAGDCYAIEYTIHSTNIGNYDPNQGIKKFDKTKIVSELEKIVQSLHLLVNSD
jgi:hypothetical protein